MSAANSLAVVSEWETLSTPVGSEVRHENERPLVFRPEEVLSELNREDTDQTQVLHVNGTSNALRITLDKLLPRLPAIPEAKEFFQAIQKWEGYVIDVDQDVFRARIAPIKGEGPEQEAEIYIEEVTEDDRALIEPGAVFYWSIGYLDRPSGRLRASILRFRRLPAWSKRELENADAGAARLRGLLNAE